MPVETTTIDTAGLTFEVLTCGDGDEIALCFHGFPDTPPSMTLLMERLADAGYRVVAPYVRGYGGTDRPPVEPGNYTSLLLGSDVFAVTTVSVTDADRLGTCVTMTVPPNYVTALDDHASHRVGETYFTAACTGWATTGGKAPRGTLTSSEHL